MLSCVDNQKIKGKLQMKMLIIVECMYLNKKKTKNKKKYCKKNLRILAVTTHITMTAMTTVTEVTSKWREQ